MRARPRGERPSVYQVDQLADCTTEDVRPAIYIFLVALNAPPSPSAERDVSLRGSAIDAAAAAAAVPPPEAEFSHAVSPTNW